MRRRDGISVRLLGDEPAVEPLDPELAERLLGLAAAVLSAEGARGHLDITTVGAETIALLNAEHMGVVGPTDVLSFPLEPFPENSGFGAGDVTGESLVGDVVLCLEVAAGQASEHAGTFADELALLLVHSCLHICGYDHADLVDRSAMWNRERELLTDLWTPLARDPWG